MDVKAIGYMDYLREMAATNVVTQKKDRFIQIFELRHKHSNIPNSQNEDQDLKKKQRLLEKTLEQAFGEKDRNFIVRNADKKKSENAIESFYEERAKTLSQYENDRMNWDFGYHKNDDYKTKYLILMGEK